MRHMAELPVTSTPAAAAWSFATLDNNTDQSGSSHNAATAPTIEESHTLINPSHAPATPEHPSSTASAGSTPRAEYSFHHNHDTFSRLPEADEHTALHGTTSSSSDEPSSPIAMDEPLSTDILPIPPPPDTTEAEQAFHQVFDNPNAIQAVDRNLDGFSDSGYSESVAQSGSTSISSSVRDFEFENGRRYHAYRSGLAYALPNDDMENEREDMKHATVLKVCGQKLHFAPLEENQRDQMRVLDIGTGTGIWCLDMADKYPSCDVLGIDLSPHQPEWVPPNCRFIIDDYESEWLYPENHFDLIHARHTCLGIKNWDHVLSSAMTALKPGGWIEFCEFTYWPNCDDGTMKPENQHLYWTNLVTEGLARFGVDLHAALSLRERVENAGYKNVTEHIIKVPIGQWPKNEFLQKVGMYMHAVLYDGLQGIAMAPLTRGLGWRAEEVELLLPGVRRDISDVNIHTYYSLHVILGQKA